jgi:hypothetical protein
MRFVRSFLFLALLATGLTAAAQEAGSFTLATATRWGAVEVPAGRYMISISNTSRVATLRPLSTPGNSVFVLPASWDYRSTCKSGSLNLVAQGGRYAADSLCLPDLGVVLYFSTPKSAPNVLAKTSVVPAESGSR